MKLINVRWFLISLVLITLTLLMAITAQYRYSYRGREAFGGRAAEIRFNLNGVRMTGEMKVRPLCISNNVHLVGGEVRFNATRRGNSFRGTYSGTRVDCDGTKLGPMRGTIKITKWHLTDGDYDGPVILVDLSKVRYVFKTSNIPW